MSKITLQIQKDILDGEYRVAVFKDGKYQEGPTYYTDDIDDLFGTAKLMAFEFVDEGHEVKINKSIKRVEGF